VATLLAARQYIEANPKGGFKRVVAVFQPHQPGRLKDFWNEFCQCFGHADLVLIADVYIARGNAIPGVDSETLVKEIAHKNAKRLAGKTETLAQQIAPILEPGDLVLTIGAGDITGVGPQLLEILQTK
jgi:UDP-N-acetylmuramate--alanine ligase